uniref:Flavodoxin-like domain-containing protein n=1 Tax=Corethron hystrix TaxID=216773 RepID=A0A7S1FM01_9STRA|mmetsp:Transcript_12536/g.27678  ORF Transcript_12536/g.27678 Transcript_12536/m.27678 type:complete len:251 (+) Transcript_12536:71-823(+)
MSSLTNHPILILYASQTGNTETAARTISQRVHKNYGYTTKCLWLDDFLEAGYDGYKTRCRWSPLVILAVSSYGVGQAPLGGYKFRAVAEHILSDDQNAKIDLNSVQFALLGLGDSTYTTFFKNPKVTEIFMAQCGAKRICDVGIGDAASTSPDQAEIIQNWIDKVLFPALDKILLKKDCSMLPSNDDILSLDSAKEETLKICETLFPDDFEKKSKNYEQRGAMVRKCGFGTTAVIVGLVFAVISVAIMKQ